jgi:hypothetical protein
VEAEAYTCDDFLAPAVDGTALDDPVRRRGTERN